jgi:hypothetical protein
MVVAPKAIAIKVAIICPDSAISVGKCGLKISNLTDTDVGTFKTTTCHSTWKVL